LAKQTKVACQECHWVWERELSGLLRFEWLWATGREWTEDFWKEGGTTSVDLQDGHRTTVSLISVKGSEWFQFN